MRSGKSPDLAEKENTMYTTIVPNQEHKDPRPSLWAKLNNFLTVVGTSKERLDQDENGHDRNALAKVANARVSKTAKAERVRQNKNSSSQIFTWKFGKGMCDARVTPIKVEGFKFAYRVTTFLDANRTGIADAKSSGFYTYTLATKVDFIAWLQSGTESIKDGIAIADLNAS